MKSLGYLSECANSWGSDQRGFEFVRYDYGLTEEGRRLCKRKKNEHPKLYREIKRLADAITSAGDVNYWELSIAAKTYFILKNHGRTATFREIQETAQGLGWDVTERELEKAADFLAKMDLIELVAAWTGNLPAYYENAPTENRGGGCAILRDWVVDGCGLVWILATGFRHTLLRL